MDPAPLLGLAEHESYKLENNLSPLESPRLLVFKDDMRYLARLLFYNISSDTFAPLSSSSASRRSTSARNLRNAVSILFRLSGSAEMLLLALAAPAAKPDSFMLEPTDHRFI